MQRFRCMFMDAFKCENGFAVITKNFAKEKPPRAEEISYFERTGFHFLERYICAKDNTYIHEKSLWTGTFNAPVYSVVKLQVQNLVHSDLVFNECLT